MDWERPPHRGQGPGGVPELEEFIRQLKLRYKIPSMPKGPFWLLGLLFVLILIGANCFFTVQSQETAVVQRFGAYVYTATPGWHLKFPFGIDTVTKVASERAMQREYGYRTLRADVKSQFSEKGFEEQSAMLSGDLNVVNLHWAVQYMIESPVDYLFQVKQVEDTLDDISESVMRRIVGNRYADEVLTIGRAAVAQMARDEMQLILNSYKTGVKIITVKLQNVNPPDPVKAAFNEVNEARQEKERMINEAQQAYNQKIPKTMGEARQLVTQAEGYALERVNRSQGDASRFGEILEAYSKAPDVTRRRMYLESFSVFLERVDRLVVIDEQQKNILPLLDVGRAAQSAVSGGRADGPTVLQPQKSSGQEGR
ncbi:MAG: FtsH protease activity modulator HflK [Syntrophobacteraceae bacterium]